MYGMEGPDEPTPADVGKFIPQSTLLGWWTKMQQKYPQVYSQDDRCPTQHGQGTKLKAFFDNDPSKPMKVEVLGSKFVRDISMADGKCPYYIVKFQGANELRTVPLTDGHEEEGWTVGW